MNNDRYYKTLGFLIEVLIRKKGISYSQFAREIGISRPTLDRVREGKTNLSLDIWLKCLGYFGKTLKIKNHES